MIDVVFHGDRPVLSGKIDVGQEGDNAARVLCFHGLPSFDENQKEYLMLTFQGRYSDAVLLQQHMYELQSIHTQFPGMIKAYVEIRTESGVRWSSKPFVLYVNALPSVGQQIMQQNPSLFDQTVEQVQKALDAADAVEKRAQAVEDFSAALGSVSVDVETLPEGESARGSAQIDRESGLRMQFCIPRGATGAKGDKGEKGDAGEKGDKGDTGAQGVKGDKGDKGTKGDKGDTGAGFAVLDYYATPAALQAAVTAPNPGDAYGVGAAAPYDVYIYGGTSGWVNNGPLQGAKGDKGDKGDTGPQGEPGAKGDKGDTGAAGPKGDKGDTGAQGADGYTPMRGTDYWTASDIAEIKTYVDDAILGGAW